MGAVLLAASSFAQSSIEFIPTAGYTFKDRIDFNTAYGRLGDAVNYGGAIQFNFNKRFGLEFMYERQDPTAKMYDYPVGRGQSPYYTTTAGINYALISPVFSAQVPGSPVHLFFGPLIGASIFTPGPDDQSSNIKFAYGLQAGTNIYITPRLGIRLSAKILSATESNDGGYYFGSFGDGSGNGGNNYYGYSNSNIYQFSLNAGLIIGLGRVFPQHAYRARPQQEQPAPRRRRYYYYN